ncbi:KAP family P-loop NTPase fold protein [Comamonas sp. B21-038]|uniref:KAP family P-loop NTPase fold protein n=1 Tax=Comamonas sp. B21-038 TaxID=2918299 RepID=UPI001EFB285E|nr:P-loop NTPase fold protein [Comamonas sp. B21-038]ULR90900.1 KAP family NTPase [Comamonas sp. B21-038]
MESNTSHWKNDLLQRKQASIFLQNIIDTRNKNSLDKNAICMAIDGDWGTGKSFFIDKWSETLREDGRCVIFFDAWKNDLSDDPLIGFISQINSGLKDWIRKIKGEETVPDKIKSRATQIFTNAAHAIIPLGKEFIKHNAMKYISNEGTQIFANISSNKNADDSNIFELKSEHIEKYFDAALKTHEMQQASIETLTRDLEYIAEGLSFIDIKPPIYIFIDELDRCRPTYAIKLLESIKHIFNAKGICFILATNINQLSQSIKAVYGGSFDGRAYLKRFIDYEYKLNYPDNFSFCAHLFSKSFLSNHPRLFSGITGSEYQDKPSDVLADIANIFQLDLRSINQIFGQVEAAIASISELEEIHCLYIFALAAIMHKNPKIIDELCMGSFKRIPDLDTMISGNGREFIESFRTNQISRITTETTTIKDLIVFYQYISTDLEQSDINSILSEDSRYRRQILQRVYNSKSAHKLIKSYPALLRMAGSLESN